MSDAVSDARTIAPIPRKEIVMATEQTFVNGIDLGVLRQTVQAIQHDPDLARCQFRARNRWIDANHNRTTIETFYAAKEERSHAKAFEEDADEPPILAGRDEAPNPVEHLLNALATCLTTAMVAHAAVRGIDIERLEAVIEGDIDLRGYLGLAREVPKGYQKIRVTFYATSDQDTETLKHLAEFSPVYNTLISGVDVDLQVEGPRATRGEPAEGYRPEAP
jgi:uncharacterized OsmC-like protein